MPKAAKLLSYSKCWQCRHDRQKCLPVERIWPGRKCDRCQRFEYLCSANRTKSKELLETSPTREASEIDNSHSMIPPNAEGSTARSRPTSNQSALQAASYSISLNSESIPSFMDLFFDETDDTDADADHANNNDDDDNDARPMMDDNGTAAVSSSTTLNKRRHADNPSISDSHSASLARADKVSSPLVDDNPLRDPTGCIKMSDNTSRATQNDQKSTSEMLREFDDLEVLYRESYRERMDTEGKDGFRKTRRLEKLLDSNTEILRERAIQYRSDGLHSDAEIILERVVFRSDVSTSFFKATESTKQDVMLLATLYQKPGKAWALMRLYERTLESHWLYGDFFNDRELEEAISLLTKLYADFVERARESYSRDDLGFEDLACHFIIRRLIDLRNPRFTRQVIHVLNSQSTYLTVDMPLAGEPLYHAIKRRKDVDVM